MSTLWRRTGPLGWVIAAFALGLVISSRAPVAQSPAPWVSYASVYAKVSPQVVNVSLDQPEARLGSGFAVSEERVITARHLVVGATWATVRTAGGESLPARVIGTDARSDLALLELETGSLAPATLGRSGRLSVGDTVLAIGNPYGLGHSLAVGVVGSRGRRLQDGPTLDYLQLTLPANPGNSGGPVFDERGEVVGVLTGVHAQGQAIAFALPVETLVDTLPQLTAGAQLTRAFLGVTAEARDGELVLTALSPRGPGDQAGLRVGDVLKAVQGEAVTTPEALRALLDRLPANAPIDVLARRAGDTLPLTVQLGDWAVTPVVVAGMTLAAEPGSGGRVLAVRPRSRAERAGVAVGDRVRAVGGRPVSAPADVQDLLQGEAAQVDLLRESVLVTVLFDWSGTPYGRAP